MAKATSDGNKAVVIAALKRAVSVIEKSMRDKSARPSEGSYPVDLELRIEGDITVGPGVPGGEPREVATLGAAELLAGALASRRSERDRERLLEAAVDAAVAAQHTGELSDLVRESASRLLSACRAAGCVETRATAGRAGAVGGKPDVRAEGTVRSRTVKVGVRGG
jgi:hypothetical protein